MSFLKVLIYAGGVGSTVAASTAGYFLTTSNSEQARTENISTKEVQNNLGDQTSDIQVPSKTKDSLKTEETDENQETTRNLPEKQVSTSLETNQGNTQTTEEKKEFFDGFLIFTTNGGKSESQGASKLKTNNPHYWVELLDKEQHDKLKNKATAEEDDDEEDDEPSQDVEIEINNLKINESEIKNYLQELTEKFSKYQDVYPKSHRTGIIDKGALKKYFEQNPGETKTFQDYFGKDLYQELLNKLSSELSNE